MGSWKTFVIPKTPILLFQLLTAIRNRSGIGEEYPMVGTAYASLSSDTNLSAVNQLQHH